MLDFYPEHLAQLTKVLEDRNKRYGDYAAGRWEWSIGELQDMMSQVLKKGRLHTPVTIFIDALDECGEETAKDLLTYFHHQANCETAQVSICVSSRHYPIIGHDNIPAVLVEENNATDIAWYTRDRLKTIRSVVKRHQIETQILHKAKGGFQWVLLVTRMMIDGELNGVKLENLHRKLTSCPATLSELYAAILSDVDEAEERQTIKLFEWILFAERPMSAQELREALVIDLDTDYTSIFELRAHDSWTDTLDDFERHVKHLSRGLVEFQTRDLFELYDPKEEDWDREAQLIHQSVADFLLERFLKRDSARDLRIFPSLAGAGHFRISRSCLRYLTLREVLDGAQIPREALYSKFALAPYCVRYILPHIHKVEQEGIIQDDLLSAMQWAPQSDNIRKLADLWRTLDPDNAHTPLGWPFVDATALHVLAACGSKTAYSAIPNTVAGELDRRDANGNTPLMLAIREKHQQIALMLVDLSVDQHSRYHKKNNGDDCEDQDEAPHANNPEDLNATNNDGDTALTIALDDNAEDLVLRLIEAGAELKYLGQQSALITLAIRSGNVTLLDVLIEKQVDLDGAVVFALEDQSVRENHDFLIIISKLLEAGGSTTRSKQFEGTSTSGHDALAVASEMGMAEIVNLLLSYGALATSQNVHGETPLLAAVRNGHNETVRALLQGAPESVEISGDDGVLVLGVALKGRRPELLDLLLRHGNYSDPVRTWKALIFKISQRGRTDMLTVMLKNHSMDPDSKNQGGCTPLSLAAEYGHDTLVKLLLDTGNVDTNSRDNNEQTPLFKAAANGHDKVVKLLLFQDADPSAANNHGWTPLDLATDHGSFVISELLLKSGASFNAKKTGRRLLNIASSKGLFAMVEQLLDKDADFASDEYGWTPLLSALHNGHGEIVKLLLERKAYEEIIANAFAQKGYTDLLRFVVERHNADLHETDIHERNSLHFAASSGNVETFQYVVSGGLDFATLNSKGWDLTNLAVSGGSLEILSLVLEQRPGPTSRPETWSPLHWACRAGNAEAVKLLVARGWRSESVVVPELEGFWTPSAIADFHGHGDMRAYMPDDCHDDFILGFTLGRIDHRPHVDHWCDGCYHVCTWLGRFGCNLTSFRISTVHASNAGPALTFIIASCANRLGNIHMRTTVGIALKLPIRKQFGLKAAHTSMNC